MDVRKAPTEREQTQNEAGQAGLETWDWDWVLEQQSLESDVESLKLGKYL